MLNRNKLFFFASFLILVSSSLSAQTSSSSPYSRYGIGDLQFSGFTKNIGMGGIANGYNPGYNMNITNPAAFSSLALTTFETAVNMNQVQLKTSSKTQNINDISLSYFAFGFPIKYKKWGTGFGLLPYSNVGYSINDLQTNAAGVTERHTYQGSGGLNQFFISNGCSPTKNFSVGMNASYLFGVISQERRIEFPYLSNYFNTRITRETSVGAVYFNFGMQLTFDSLKFASGDSIKMLDQKLNSIHDSLEKVNNILVKSTAEQKTTWELTLKELNRQYAESDSVKKHVLNRNAKSDWSLTLGLTGSPGTSLAAKYTSVTESFLYSAFDNIIVRDTVQFTDGKSGTLKLPLNIGFGMMMKEGNRWLIGSDVTLQNWKDYSIFGVNDSLGNSWRVSAGAQWHPKPGQNDLMDKKISYWKKIQYRMGFHYGQTYLQLRNNKLMEYGLSIGLGLPIKRSAAMLHLAAEIGRRGTTTEHLIQENYLKLSVGFTLNDRWFIKPKFD